jgi:hypothetical protein
MTHPFAAPAGQPFGDPVALRDPARPSLVRARLGRIAAGKAFLPAERKAARPSTPTIRVTLAHIEWVAERLSKRDRAIAADAKRLRLVTGLQFERLHFAWLSDGSRARRRRLVLARLSDWRVLAPQQRRVGGSSAGSTGLTFALDSAGDWLLRPPDHPEYESAHINKPNPPSERLFKHTLAVSELYVELVELARYQRFELQEFATEPAWVFGRESRRRPDAYVRLATPHYTDSWLVEQDMATEHELEIRRKLRAYLDFVERGQLGPDGIIPRVLISTRTAKQAVIWEEVIRSFAEPASKLFHVITSDRAAAYMVLVLRTG